MAVRLSALRFRRTLLPRNIIILMFLVLISVRTLKRGLFLRHHATSRKVAGSSPYVIELFFHCTYSFLLHQQLNGNIEPMYGICKPDFVMDMTERRNFMQTIGENLPCRVL
jgi:hypothetical protein